MGTEGQTGLSIPAHLPHHTHNGGTLLYRVGVGAKHSSFSTSIT